MVRHTCNWNISGFFRVWISSKLHVFSGGKWLLPLLLHHFLLIIKAERIQTPDTQVTERIMFINVSRQPKHKPVSRSVWELHAPVPISVDSGGCGPELKALLLLLPGAGTGVVGTPVPPWTGRLPKRPWPGICERIPPMLARNSIRPDVAPSRTWGCFLGTRSCAPPVCWIWDGALIWGWQWHPERCRNFVTLTEGKLWPSVWDYVLWDIVEPDRLLH